MKSLLSILAKLDRSLSPLISRSIALSLHSWLLGISIITAVPIVSIVSETQPAQAGVARAFTKRYQTQINGTIRIVGNSNTTCSTNVSTCANARMRSGTGAVLNNNNNTIEYVNVAGGVFNSSSADFVLPANATIKSASLYWGANTAGSPNARNSANKNIVQFKIGSGSYQPLTADQVDLASDGAGGGSATAYNAFKDVTSLVKNQPANSTQTYAVADIQAGLGNDRYSGWSLIIVYEDPAEPWRELNVFDGFAVVANSTGNKDITTNISGFSTPAIGAFNAEFGAFAYEGDMGTSGDTFSINSVLLGGTGTINNNNNFWDSSISTLAPYNRTPNYTNTFGLDIDLVTLTTGATGVIKNGDTSASLNFTTGLDAYFPGAFTFAVDAAAISGRVFEDVNYGGGSGRNYATANASAQASGFPLTVGTDRIGATGAIVELYDSNSNFVSVTTTDAQGRYSFFKNISAGNYFVRVVNSSVKSVRTGNATPGLIPVPTFQTDGATGLATANTNLVGGKDLTRSDSAANTTNQKLNTIFAQSVSQVVVAENDAVPDTDFGFNFDTIVNTRDSGQGSLRQFIINSNALKNNTALAQQGLTAGQETSIFMIPNGTTRPGLQASLTNQVAGTGGNTGSAVITLLSPLNAILDDHTSIDGTTQSTNVGNTNAGQIGSQDPVGTTGLAISQVDLPEITIDGRNLTNSTNADQYALTLNGEYAILRGIAVYGTKGDYAVPASGDSGAVRVGTSFSNNVTLAGAAKIQNNLIGTLANGSDPGSALQNQRYGTICFGPCQIENNYLAYNGYGTVFFGSGSDGSNAIGNQYQFNGPNIAPGTNPGMGSAEGDSVSIWSGSNITIQGNRIANTRGVSSNTLDGGKGIEVVNTIGQNATNNKIQNNTIDFSSTAGIGLYNGAINNTIYQNIISNTTPTATSGATSPVGAGIVISFTGSILPERNKISQNSIFDNKGLGIDLEPRAWYMGDGVTANDGLTSNLTPNIGIDYPIITSSVLSGSTLTLKGFVGSNPAGSTTFAGATLEFFVGAPNTNDKGKVFSTDPATVSKLHAEGQTYIGGSTAGNLCVTDANSLFTCSFPNVTALVTDPKNITATATNPAGNTSEFSSVPSAKAQLLIVKRITAIKDGATGNVTNFGAFDDNPANTNDNNCNWLTATGATGACTNTYTVGKVNGGAIKPGDEVEYTIYYLNAGDSGISKARICDRLDKNLIFQPDFNTANISKGIVLAEGNSAIKYLTNTGTDTDRGQLADATTANCNLIGNTGTNLSNSVVAVDVANSNNFLSGSTGAGIPTTSYGYIRFKVKVRDGSLFP